MTSLTRPAFDFKTQYSLGFNAQDDAIVVDYFYGGGGAGTGQEMGLGRKVSVAKNHHAAAISMPKVNDHEPSLSDIGLRCTKCGLQARATVANEVKP